MRDELDKTHILEWYASINDRLWQCPECQHVWHESRDTCQNCWESTKPSDSLLFKVHPEDRWAFDCEGHNNS